MRYLKYFENLGEIKYYLHEIIDNDKTSTVFNNYYKLHNAKSYVKPEFVKSYEHIATLETKYDSMDEDDLIQLGTTVKRLKQQYDDIDFIVDNKTSITYFRDLENDTF